MIMLVIMALAMTVFIPLLWQVRHSKPPLPHGLPIDAQVTVVGATLPEDFLVSTLAEVVPVSSCWLNNQ